MKFTVSLKKNAQFRSIYNRGKSIANKTLVMYIVRNNEDENRLGVTVSKKVGKAVIRNKVRRRIKESYRSLELNIKKGYDIIIIARISCKESTYSEVLSAVKHLLKKHDLFVQ